MEFGDYHAFYLPCIVSYDFFDAVVQAKCLERAQEVYLHQTKAVWGPFETLILNKAAYSGDRFVSVFSPMYDFFCHSKVNYEQTLVLLQNAW